MKNWKKLLACLLVSLMALTVFTACDASVGAPMSPKRSDAESAKALCDKFKMIYNEEMTYNEDLSEKAYSIANWVAGTSVSCDTNDNKTELYRVGNANNEARAFLKEENYAAAFENLSMGTFGLNDFVPGFDIKTAEWSSKDDSITFGIQRHIGHHLCSAEGRHLPRSHDQSRKGQDQTGRCLCGKGRRKLRRGAVWVNFITTNKAAAALSRAAAALFVLGYDQPFRKAGRGLPSLSHW